MKKINIAYIMLFVVILITVFGIFYKTREMEFAESPIPLGVHYIVDIDNIKNKNLYSNEFIKNLCSKLLSNTGVNVLNEIHHEFQPQGYTALYLLSESHMSIHTWPENGKIRVDFFDENQSYLESRVLKKGDIILLAKGGHGFEMLEKSEIIEVKQGPYAGDNDKTRFDDNEENKIIDK